MDNSNLGQWPIMSEYEKQDVIAPAAAALGITPERAVDLVTAGIAAATHEAKESTSDPAAPIDLILLAAAAQESTGQQITAIKTDTYQNSPVWYFVILGNPIIIESWLQDRGYNEAFALSPTICIVRSSQI